MTEPVGTDRRGVLKGAAVIGVAGAVVGLAACGGDDDATSPSGSPSGAGGGKPSGSIVETSEVPVGGGRVVNAGGTKVVVTQPQDGTFKAFSAVCTHQGCTVGSVEGGTINCPCHGSKFAVADGTPTAGPAKKPLPEKAVAVEGSSVVLA